MRSCLFSWCTVSPSFVFTLREWFFCNRCTRQPGVTVLHNKTTTINASSSPHYSVNYQQLGLFKFSFHQIYQFVNFIIFVSPIVTFIKCFTEYCVQKHATKQSNI